MDEKLILIFRNQFLTDPIRKKGRKGPFNSKKYSTHYIRNQSKNWDTTLTKWLSWNFEVSDLILNHDTYRRHLLMFLTLMFLFLPFSLSKITRKIF